MLIKRVCFVLGAGASVPYGFPSGGDLVNFAKQKQPDEWWPLVNDALGVAKPFHDEFVEKLHNSGVPSLDHFAGKLSEFKEYTKALIAYYIGKAEDQHNLIHANVTRDWSLFFINQLTDGLEFRDIRETPLDVVTFNFDRSLQEALLVRLSTQFGKSRMEVAEAISHWNVVHVHGSLGDLPELAKNGPGRAYHQTLNPDALKLAAANIVLLNDAETGSPNFQKAQELISQADLVFILGFGFHRLNCERVFPQPWPNVAGPSIYATVQGLSDGKRNKAEKYFSPGPGLNQFNDQCLSLLRRFEHLYSD